MKTETKCWHHDGSFIGLLSAADLAFKNRTPSCGIPQIVSERDSLLFLSETIQKDLFEKSKYIEETEIIDDKPEVFDVVSNQEIARDFFRKLKKRSGFETTDALFHAWHSDMPALDGPAAFFLCSAWDSGSDAWGNLADPRVNYLMRAAQRARREKHLFMGIVRFRELSDGTFYAPVNPDCDILPLIAQHFHLRFFAQDWIIHDLHKAKALFHKRNGTTEGLDIDAIEGINISDLKKGAELPESMLAPTEKYVSEAFRLYFSNISILERSNSVVQRNFLPKKYWLHLVERPGN